MLDLSAIPVVDNHCHPILLDQAMDSLRFRRFFTESSSPDLRGTTHPEYGLLSLDAAPDGLVLWLREHGRRYPGSAQ